MITFAVVRFVNHEYDYRPTSDETKSTGQSIKITIFEKAQEIKILVGIQGTRSLTTLKIIS